MIQRRFRPAGNGLLFDNPLNYEGLRLDSGMEKGYEEGCTRGAILKTTNPFDVISTEWFEESKSVIGGIAYPANKYAKVIYEAS